MMILRTAFWTLAVSLVFLTARADDITLKDGTVVQGKIVKRIPTKDGKVDLVVQIDEEGTTKTIPAAKIERYKRTAPPWVVRKRNLRKYKKKLEKAKKTDDWKKQMDLAEWCLKMELKPEAAEHHAKATELRIASTPRESKALEELIEWCSKLGLDAQVLQVYETIYEIKKEQLKEDTAAAHVKLAEWAFEIGLVKIARQEYEAALAKDPGNQDLKDMLNQLEGRRTSKDEAYVQEMMSQGRGWTISLGIADDADDEYLANWEEKIKRVSRWIWDATQGIFFIAEATLEDKAQRCQINIPAGRMHEVRHGGRGVAVCHMLGSPQWYVRVGGKIGIGTIGHEMFHGVFGILDEYGGNPRCPCVMADAPAPHKVCDSSTHLNSGRQRTPCWDAILKRYGDKGARFPNPDWTTVSETEVPHGQRKDGGYEYFNDAGFNSTWVSGKLNVDGRIMTQPPPTRVAITNR